MRGGIVVEDFRSLAAELRFDACCQQEGDGSDKPYRLKVRAPSFANLQALQYLLRDAYVADAVVILGSIDIILGEVDR